LTVSNAVACTDAGCDFNFMQMGACQSEGPRTHEVFQIGEATKRTALDSLPDLTAPAKAPKTERSNRS